jgi:hypothetical protein
LPFVGWRIFLTVFAFPPSRTGRVGRGHQAVVRRHRDGRCRD